VVIWDSGQYNLIEGNYPLKEFKNGKLVFKMRRKRLKGNSH
jgi:hypothetical protein